MPETGTPEEARTVVAGETGRMPGPGDRPRRCPTSAGSTPPRTVDDIIAGVRHPIPRYGSVSRVPDVLAEARGDAYVGY